MTYDCVVVGAGAAGVTTSRALADAGVDHLVLERGTDRQHVGHPAVGRVPAQHSRVDERSARSRRARTSTRHGTRPWSCSRRRAEDLPVRAGTTVTSVRREGDVLRVTTADEELEARTLVVASGPKNVPLRPAAAANLAPHLMSIDADHYRNPAALPEGGVMVVGGGQSGGQIAEDLVLGGRTVWWSTSRIARYRAQYRGRALLDWHVAAGWWATPPEALPDPEAMRTATPLIASNGRDLGIPKLGRMGVNLVGRLAEVDGARLAFTGDVNEFVAFGDQVAVTLEKIADDYISAAGIDAPSPEPDDGRGPVDVPDRPTLDLDREGITTVIWCTGFGGDYAYLPEVGQDAYGFPVLDRERRRRRRPGDPLRRHAVAVHAGVRDPPRHAPRRSPRRRRRHGVAGRRMGRTQPPDFVACCDRARCSAICASNSSRQDSLTAIPARCASSVLSSTGKPKVSERTNSSAPVTPVFR